MTTGDVMSEQYPPRRPDADPTADPVQPVWGAPPPDAGRSEPSAERPSSPPGGSSAVPPGGAASGQSYGDRSREQYGGPPPYGQQQPTGQAPYGQEQHGQQQYDQQQYGQQQYAQQQYGQQQYGQQQYDQQQYGQSYGGGSGYGAPPAGLPQGLSIAALVVGVLAFLICWLPVIGLVVALVALVLGTVAVIRTRQGRAGGKGLAIGGLVLGILSTLAGFAVTAFMLWAIAQFGQSGDLQSIVECARITDSAEQERCLQERGLSPSTPAEPGGIVPPGLPGDGEASDPV